MKLRISIVAAIAALFSLWFLFRTPNQGPVEPSNAPKRIVERPSKKPEKDSSELIQEFLPTIEERRIMSKTQVEFYGRVLDQNDEPVPETKISCSWPHMGTRYAPIRVITDSDGRFEITDLKASSILISTKPPAGYRELPRDQRTNRRVQIAEPPERIKRNKAYKAQPPTSLAAALLVAQAYKPDKSQPMIFRVEKLGSTDALYKKGLTHRNKTYGRDYYFSVKGRSSGSMDRPPDNHSIGFSFSLNEAERMAYDENRLTSPQYSWSLRLHVPGGGIQVVPGDHSRLEQEEIFRNNETAPEDGYQDEILLDFPKAIDAKQWKDRTRAVYFIRFKDGTFARAVITASKSIVSIKSYYNPTGSRNLVYDHHKRIKE